GVPVARRSDGGRGGSTGSISRIGRACERRPLASWATTGKGGRRPVKRGPAPARAPAGPAPSFCSFGFPPDSAFALPALFEPFGVAAAAACSGVSVISATTAESFRKESSFARASVDPLACSGEGAGTGAPAPTLGTGVRSRFRASTRKVMGPWIGSPFARARGRDQRSSIAFPAWRTLRSRTAPGSRESGGLGGPLAPQGVSGGTPLPAASSRLQHIAAQVLVLDEAG